MNNMQYAREEDGEDNHLEAPGPLPRLCPCTRIGRLGATARFSSASFNFPGNLHHQIVKSYEDTRAAAGCRGMFQIVNNTIRASADLRSHILVSVRVFQQRQGPDLGTKLTIILSKKK